MTSSALSLEALDQAVRRLPDDRLTASRQAALLHLREHGLPTTRDEDWKYTDLARLVDIGNRWLELDAPAPPSSACETIANRVRESIDADWLVIANGIIDGQCLEEIDRAGLQVERLSESDAGVEFSAPLSSLNIALLHDGLRISVAANTALTRPIGILIVDDAETAPGMSQSRIEIDLAAGSAASFIEYHASAGAAEHFANSVSTLRLGDSARTDFVRIQERAPGHSQTGRLDVGVGRDSTFSHCAFDLGGRLIRNDLSVDIGQPGAHVAFHGLYLAGGQQHVDNHTRADHRVGPATSHQEYRGIVTGSARAVWNGKAIVHDGADGTDADQANHNLLLSDRAEIDAKPELEIYADDVKCSHGTTIGQLDESALFYLRTRGLNKHEARQVLTRAFAEAIVSKSPIESLHELLAARIGDRLSSLMQETDT